MTTGMACAVINGVNYVGVTGIFAGNAAKQNGGCLMAVRSRLNIKSNTLFQGNVGRCGQMTFAIGLQANHARSGGGSNAMPA